MIITTLTVPWRSSWPIVLIEDHNNNVVLMITTIIIDEDHNNDYASQMLSAPNTRDLSTNECATCEEISHLPYCRRSSTIDTIPDASVIRIPWGQRRQRREEPG
ncbi:hypothetical protein CEXT_712831 [Caerostris extrusa]|uniref:Uncharacterized protein n=1 Tax=Caerostris extrusa TaxID=172846 RepID=A0AAV4RQ77_CAEEX|nr:hypothetical protein CEXT_712831 [Caerostris extrusa]